MNEKELGQTLGAALVLGIVLLGGKFRQRRTRRQLLEELVRTHKREMYLAGMLDKYGVEVEEFDLIALTNL